MTLPDDTTPLDQSLRAEKSFAQKFLPIIVLGVCIALAYWITQSTPPASKGFAKKPSPLLVEAITLSASDYHQRFNSYGRVQAKQHTDLLPLVSGQVIEIFPAFESGRYFKRGQKLLQLEKSDYEVELQIALSELASAELKVAEEEARAEQAERDWQVQKRRNPSAKINDFALRKPQLKSAQANLQAAKARIALAQTNLDRTTITAPFDGRFDTTHIGIGSVVTTSSVLAKLYDTSVLEVRLPIANDDLAFIDLPLLDAESTTQNKKPHDEFSVQFENSLTVPAEQWRGQLVRSDASLDESSQQLYLVAQIQTGSADNKNQALKIGQYVKAQIQGKPLRRVISIPNSAIYQGSYVYLVKTNEKGLEQIQRRNIQIRWRNDSISIIQEGLIEGDRLVITPLGQVTSGTLVTLTEEKNESTQQTSQPNAAGETP